MLRFTKMNGAGNDFVLIDNRAGEVNLTPQQIARISFETPAGVIGAELQGDVVRLTMSEPRDERFDLKISAGDESWRGHFINSGVPHVVVPVSDVEKVDVNADGAMIRRHAMFAPAGTNANFLEK